MYLISKKVYYFLIFITFIFVCNPVHAYAGPGVAIGAIIVFFSIIIAFFASFFIKLFKVLKRICKFCIRILSKKKTIKKSKKE